MGAKIAFAGKTAPRQPSAATLFRAGRDTVQIAEILGITEAQASRRVFIERCKRRKLAMGFEPRDLRRPGRSKVAA